jgi:hypothetical protein
VRFFQSIIALVTGLLFFTDKNLPKQQRWGVRYSLLYRWAESDINGAMA